MDDLANKKCIPCEGGIPAFDIKEIHKYLKKVDGWDVLEDKDKNFYIEKNFKFSNYVESEKFVISVGKIAETEDTTQILLLVGDTLKLKFLLMPLKAWLRAILF